MRPRLSALLPALALALALALPGAAAELAEGPFLIHAESLTYDSRLEVVTASGNVEISDESRILLADRVAYDMRAGVVRASGNVSLLEPNGDVVFAEELELDDDLGAGFVRGVRVLLANDARIAANGARRFENGDMALTKAVYSPCELCRDEPEKPPLWRIKAARVVHDAGEREVRYRDAVLEVFGVPVLYTPYFAHPDPTVERKSGFLPPRFGRTGELGFTVEVPYYFDLAPHRGLTVAPIATSKEGLVLQAEYRELTASGGFDIEGSGTYVRERNALNVEGDDREVRGHVFSKGRFDIDPHWRWGFDANRASDDTYLRRYNFSNAHTLTSDLFLEGFHGRDYTNFSAFAFQGLRAGDDAGLTPFVAPFIEYMTISEPGILGSTYSLGLSAVSLQRTEGTDTARASLRGFVDLPYVSPLGDVYTLTAGLTGDLYWMNDTGLDGVPPSATDDGFEARLLPHFGLGWRFPFVRHAEGYRQTVEPVVQVAYTPGDGRASEIPNEDSISVEFDDTNVFDFNRFPGYDRVETGLRLNYGVRASVYGDDGGYGSLLLGHVLRLGEDADFDSNSGLATGASDLVAALTVSPNEYFDLVTRIRVDPDDFTVRRNEVYASVGDSRYRLTGSYVFFDKDFNAALLDEREEIYLNGRARLSDYWSVMASGRRDLSDGRWTKAGFGFRYEDECLVFEFGLERDFTEDRDVEPSTTVGLRVVLKQLN